MGYELNWERRRKTVALSVNLRKMRGNAAEFLRKRKEEKMKWN